MWCQSYSSLRSLSFYQVTSYTSCAMYIALASTFNAILYSDKFNMSIFGDVQYHWCISFLGIVYYLTWSQQRLCLLLDFYKKKEKKIDLVSLWCFARRYRESSTQPENLHFVCWFIIESYINDWWWSYLSPNPLYQLLAVTNLFELWYPIHYYWNLFKS